VPNSVQQVLGALAPASLALRLASFRRLPSLARKRAQALAGNSLPEPPSQPINSCWGSHLQGDSFQALAAVTGITFRAI